jgi:hypothetical protein
VQQHPGHRSPLAPPSVQQSLDARVAIQNAVLLAKLLVKLPHAEIEILFLVPAQNLFGRVIWIVENAEAVKNFPAAHVLVSGKFDAGKKVLHVEKITLVK